MKLCLLFINQRPFQLSSSNPLLTRQEAAMCWLLLHCNDICVLSADKNLGPAVMERSKYIHYAFKDHLNNKNTYLQRLSESGANFRLDQTSNKSLNSRLSLNKAFQKQIKVHMAPSWKKWNLTGHRRSTQYAFITNESSNLAIILKHTNIVFYYSTIIFLN